MILSVRMMRELPRPDDRPHFPDRVTIAELEMDMEDWFAERVFADVLAQVGGRDRTVTLGAEKTL